MVSHSHNVFQTSCNVSHQTVFCSCRYFPSIYNMSKQPDNPWFDYHQNPRAQIFKRDQGKVDSLSTMIKLMRYLLIRKSRTQCPDGADTLL